MKRLINYDLKQWKSSSIRKPLLMRGARQVGKTYAVRELGKTFQNMVEINFELHPDFATLFEKDLDPVRIINALVAITMQSIIPGNTLLFFDEIQACPKAIIALRYFYEQMPELHVIAAGSLLDFAIEQVGMPVGRIQFCYVYPLSFMEYLASLGNNVLFEMILRNVEKPLDTLFHAKLFELLGQYVLLGGMPKIIAESLIKNDFSNTYSLQDSIIAAYQNDFPKYAKKFQIKYVETLFEYIPRSISHTFKYTHVDGDFQKRELAPALSLLEKAGIIHKVYQTAGNGLPLGAEMRFEKFKVLFLDVGLNQRMLGNNVATWLLNSIDSFINKGALTESFVGQELMAYGTDLLQQHLYYWHRESRSSNAEVDYLIQLDSNIIPVEVKSGKSGTLKSLHAFLAEKSHSPFGIRFSTRSFSVKEKLHSYPLYAIAGVLAKYNSDLREKLFSLVNE